MAKYRKKPIVIDAIQWDGSELSEFPEWLKEPFANNAVMRVGNEVHIQTLEGQMIASPGDYIIRGIKGEIYPCKPDIFANSYDVVE